MTHIEGDEPHFGRVESDAPVGPDISTVLVIGAGSLGLVYAAALAACGTGVTLLVRQGRAAALRSSGAITVAGALDRRVPIASASTPGDGAIVVTDDPAEIGSYAAALFTTKGPGLASAIETVGGAAASLPANAWFAGFQNGVVKDDLLASAFGVNRVLGVASVIGAEREAPDFVRVTGLGATLFGELGAAPSSRVDAAARLFRRAGLPSVVVADGRRLAWTKFAHAVGVFGVSSLTGLPSGELFRRRRLILAYRALVDEVAAVARASGIELADFENLPIATNLAASPDALADRFLAASTAPIGPASYSSMLQDLRAHRPTEVDEIFGDLARRGDQLGVATPRSDLVFELISGMDSGNDG